MHMHRAARTARSREEQHNCGCHLLTHFPGMSRLKLTLFLLCLGGESGAVSIRAEVSHV